MLRLVHSKLFLALSCVFVALACGGDNPTEPDYSTITDISYEQHVQVILTEYANILRDNNIFPEGLQVDSWDNLIKGWERGEVVIPFDAENSLLIELTTKLESATELRADKLDLLVRWINEGAMNDDDEIPYENSTDLLYVCDQAEAKVSIIDVDARVVIRTVDLLDLNMGFSLTSNPHHVAVEPDGSFWYLSLIGENKVLKFNRDNELVGNVDVAIPALLAAHPSNGLLYVSRFPQAPGEIPQTVAAVDRASMQFVQEIAVRPTPHAMASDHTGDYVYTCSLSESQVIAIDAATNEAEDPIQLGAGKGPIQLTVSPDDATVVVSNQLSNEMIVIDVQDPNNRTVVKTIPVNRQPWHPVFTAAGNRVYVGNFGANTISVVDISSGQVETIGDGTGTDGVAQPHGIAISQDGQFVFVSCRNIDSFYKPRFDFGDNSRIGTVVVVNTGSNTIEKIIEIENFGSGMAISQF